jgi:hypothetical protein
MLALLLITALFVVLCIYFFFRAEKLQNTLRLLKRDKGKILKENTMLTESIALIASNHEEIAKIRLQLLLADNENQPYADTVKLIQPFINNYVIIFNACLKEKGRLHGITKECFDNQNSDEYKNFINKIIKNDEKLQRLWESNNVIGFISLVEALLIKYNTEKENSVSLQKEII